MTEATVILQGETESIRQQLAASVYTGKKARGEADRLKSRCVDFEVKLRNAHLQCCLDHELTTWRGAHTSATEELHMAELRVTDLEAALHEQLFEIRHRVKTERDAFVARANQQTLS